MSAQCGMSLTLRLCVVATALSSVLGIARVAADPASSEQSAWWPLANRTASSLKDPLERRGQAVFYERCEACHGEIPEQIFGPPFLPPMPGTEALKARYGDTRPAALEKRTDLTPEFVQAIVRGGLRAMPFFRPTELSNDDLEALSAYLTRQRD
jgi:mono/diheme cytochrome c family protein